MCEIFHQLIKRVNKKIVPRNTDLARRMWNKHLDTMINEFICEYFKSTRN